MRISISGAQGTGKSTLLAYLRDDFVLSKDYVFKGNITRSIKDLGISINEDGSDTSQLLVISKHIEHYAHENAILDRCALDGLVYTAYLYEQGKVRRSTLRIAESVFENLKYDIMFYIAPEFDIEDDTVRSTDLVFRQRIVDLFEEYMEAYNITPIRLTGSVTDRAEQVKETINQFNRYKDEITKEIVNTIEEKK